MTNRKTRVVSFLAPTMLPVYESMIGYVSRNLQWDMEVVAGSSYDELYQADFSFVCGLPYVLRTAPRLDPSPIVAIVAPVLQGERYQNKPIYFSDVIVRQDSSFHSFDDLRGCSWAYNERQSQSGYGVTRYWLVKLGQTHGYFSRVVEAGFHQNAIRMVCEGEVDASAIDSLVLAIERRDHPELEAKLRVIDSLGPSTIQPLVAATRIAPSLIEDVQSVFIGMHNDSRAMDFLRRGFIDHFVAVQDNDYDDIRQMMSVCEAADFIELR
ncbi:MAG TPA: PhnD/SsuA/transferrin family substrate-binding protein [Aggregatilineaceae bacterium]|nr:PhnD/SsuA/transferrin family substrate-binding protein [Aggregatilineaceae bacterium]